MAGWAWPEMSPWRRRGLTIPPKSLKAWFELALWECWMGLLIYAAMSIGTQLIGAAPQSIVTFYDFSRCYATGPVAQPCERVAYQTGALNAAFTVWCGVLLVTVGAWMLWELWNAAAPKPITDDFLKLLDDSFGRDWHRPRTWPWGRLACACCGNCSRRASCWRFRPQHWHSESRRQLSLLSSILFLPPCRP